jgi:hypothetical protein
MTGRDHQLLAVLFDEPADAGPCDGTMTCGCERCAKQRSVLVRIGGRGSGARQPWQLPQVQRHAA